MTTQSTRAATPLTTAVLHLTALQAALTRHRSIAKEEDARLCREIADFQKSIALASGGLDPDQITLARTVVFVRGAYARGGEGRESVVRDAVKELACGPDLLRRVQFGTKDYDCFSGQRTDCGYGYGPKHGHIVFAVGLTQDARERELTNAETEAAIYLLTRLEAVQNAEAVA